MKERIISLCKSNISAAKFLCVGISASAVHALISWIFYYHIWSGTTLLSTLMGYSGGWIVSYLGNRLWSFKVQARGTSVTGSSLRFVVSQLVAMVVLLSSTGCIQQLVILYFYWYIITNDLSYSGDLERFCRGASYPPALFCGMAIAAVCSYLIMRAYVFRNKS